MKFLAIYVPGNSFNVNNQGFCVFINRHAFVEKLVNFHAAVNVKMYFIVARDARLLIALSTNKFVVKKENYKFLKKLHHYVCLWIKFFSISSLSLLCMIHSCMYAC